MIPLASSAPGVRPGSLRPLLVLVLLAAMLPGPAQTQSSERYDGPIIDMHLHGYTADSYWGAIPNPATGQPAPATAAEHAERSLAAMREHGVVLGVVSGESPEAAASWADRTSNRVLRGLVVEDPADLDVEDFVAWVEEGRLEVFAEIGAQYGGFSPSDPAFEPFWSEAETRGVPVGIHTGESFPGTPYECCPRFRLRFGDPLLLEEMLVRHPDLKVFVMHAGGWFYDRALMLMHMYPQVYAGVGVLTWIPGHRDTRTLEAFLKEARTRGMLDRVMFGSDQMVWPGAIGASIETVQSLEFLTTEEKKAIFYDNAARFLQLSEEEIARHHAG